MSVLETASRSSLDHGSQKIHRSARPSSAPAKGRQPPHSGRQRPHSGIQNKSVSEMERLWAAGTELEDMLRLSTPSKNELDLGCAPAQSRSRSQHSTATVLRRQPRSATTCRIRPESSRRLPSSSSPSSSMGSRMGRQQSSSAAPGGYPCGKEQWKNTLSFARGDWVLKSKDERQECLALFVEEMSENLRTVQQKGQARCKESQTCEEAHGRALSAKPRGDKAATARRRRREIEELRKSQSTSLSGQPWQLFGACLSRTRGAASGGLFSDVQGLGASESEASFMESRGRTWRPQSAPTSSRPKTLGRKRRTCTREESRQSTPDLSQELSVEDRRLPHERIKDEFPDSDSDERMLTEEQEELRQRPCSEMAKEEEPSKATPAVVKGIHQCAAQGGA